jgi:hypothetical protein
MTQRRTPYSNTPIPENFNRTDRPPVESSDFDPQTANFLTQPRLLERIQALVREGRLHPADANHALVELRRHYRALNGDRSRPGEILGRQDLPYLPMPFAPREQVRYAPGTNRGDVMTEAVHRMDADRITDTLVHQMSENDPPHVHQRTAERADAPPSLHDTISAAVDSLGN